MTTRRPRGPTIPEGERALWDQITRDVEPLQRCKRRKAADAAPPAASLVEAAPAPVRRTTLAETAKPVSKPPPPLAPIDRRVRRALARGGADVDARIDLHGLTQQAAHTKLKRFLLRAQADGARLVLVITGKGGPDAGTSGEMWGETRGVLRRQVPLWLQAPDLRAVVVGFEAANIGHGGDGALYVRVRRRRVTDPR